MGRLAVGQPFTVVPLVELPVGPPLMKDTDVQIFCGCLPGESRPGPQACKKDSQCVIVMPEDVLFRIVEQLPEFQRRYNKEKNMEQEDRLTPSEEHRVSTALSIGRKADICRVCHEVNKAYCEALGDHSQPSWEDAPQWQKDSSLDGVEFYLGNPGAGPAAQHISWMNQRLDDGWIYGSEKNVDFKTHPCLVPFAELPQSQQAKDYIFRAIVHAMR